MAYRLADIQKNGYHNARSGPDSLLIPAPPLFGCRYHCRRPAGHTLRRVDLANTQPLHARLLQLLAIISNIPVAYWGSILWQYAFSLGTATRLEARVTKRKNEICVFPRAFLLSPREHWIPPIPVFFIKHPAAVQHISFSLLS